MASSVSYEYIQAQKGVPGGFATLTPSSDPNPGTIPIAQLPPNITSPFKGQFADETELETEYPTANLADYAYCDDTSSFWYWNIALTTPAWVNQEIPEADYIVLSSYEQSVVPYIVTPAA